MTQLTGPGSGRAQAAAALPALDQGCLLGFVGLGAQGRALARHWADKGHKLVLFDVRREALDEFERDGAIAATSPAAVAAQVALTALCVVDDQQVEQVVLGPDGLLAGAAAGSIIVVHSTFSLGCLARITAAAKERQVTILDAPVSGGGGRAGTATSYMIGGPWETVRHCLHLFGKQGENVTYTGPSGTGIKAKLAHQVVLCGNILAAAEGYRLGAAAGLDRSALRDVLRFGVAHSRAADQLEAIFASPGTMELWDKDLELAIEWAKSLGIELPLAKLVRECLPAIFGDVPPW